MSSHVLTIVLQEMSESKHVIPFNQTCHEPKEQEEEQNKIRLRLGTHLLF